MIMDGTAFEEFEKWYTSYTPALPLQSLTPQMLLTHYNRFLHQKKVLGLDVAEVKMDRAPLAELFDQTLEKATTGRTGVKCDDCGRYYSYLEIHQCPLTFEEAKREVNAVLQEGVKYDDDKLRYDLIPVVPLAELARVYTTGAKKYAPRNWEKGMRWGRLFASCQRHLNAFWLGETWDPESGCHHLSAAVFACFALMEYQYRGIGNDDRPYPEDIEPWDEMDDEETPEVNEDPEDYDAED